MQEKLLKVKEVAKFLRMNPITVYRFAQQGKIPAFKIGSEWRFRMSAIDNWIIERENGNGKNIHHVNQLKLKMGS